MVDSETLEIVLRARDELSKVLQDAGAKSVAELRKIHEANLQLASGSRDVRRELEEQRKAMRELAGGASEVAESFDFREARQQSVALAESFDAITGTRVPQELAEVQRAGRAAATGLEQAEDHADQAGGAFTRLRRDLAPVLTGFRTLQRVGVSLVGFVRRSMLPALLALGGAYVGLSGIQRVTANASEFQTAWAEVGTIARGSAEDLARLRQEVLDLSVAHGVNERVVARGLYEALSAGFERAADAAEILGEAQRLGTAGVASTNETVDLLTTTLNAYRFEVSESARVSDVFFEAVRIGKTTISELSSTIGLALPLASTLGVRIEEVTAAIAVMTNQGFATGEAVTGVRNLFKQLLTEGEAIDKMLRRTGGSFDFNSVRARGLADVLGALADSAKDPTEVMQVLGGRVEAANALFALTGANIEDFRRTLEELEGSAGAVEQALAKMLGIDAARARQLMQALRVEALAFGDAVLKAIRETVDELGGIEAVQGRFRILAAELAPLLGEAVKAIGEMVTSFGLFRDDVELTMLRFEGMGTRWGNIAADLGAPIDTARSKLRETAGEVVKLQDRLEDARKHLREYVADLPQGFDPTRGDDPERNAILRNMVGVIEGLEQELALKREIEAEERAIVDAQQAQEVSRQKRIADLEEELRVRRGERAASGGPVTPFFDVIPDTPGLAALKEAMAEADRMAEVQRLRAEAATEQAEVEIVFREQLLGLEQQYATSTEHRIALEHEAFSLSVARLGKLQEEAGLSDEHVARLRQGLEEILRLNVEALEAADAAAAANRERSVAEEILGLRRQLVGVRGDEAEQVAELISIAEEEHRLALASMDARILANQITTEEAESLRELLDLLFQINREEAKRGDVPQEPRNERDHRFFGNTLALGRKELQELSAEGRALHDTLASNLGEGIFDAFIEGTKSAKEAFEDFGRSVLRQLAQIAAQQAALAIIGGIFGVATGGAGFVAGAATTAATTEGAAKGAIFPGEYLPFQAFSKGGIATKPMLGLIREAGQNEAVVPLPDNRSIPVKWQGEGPSGGDSTVNINITMAPQMLDTRSLKERVPEIAKEIGEAVEGELSRRPGLRARVRSVSAGRG